MKQERTFRKLLLVLTVSCAFSSPLAHAVVTDQDSADDAKTTNEVVRYGKGLQSQRFSTID